MKIDSSSVAMNAAREYEAISYSKITSESTKFVKTMDKNKKKR